MKKQFLLLASLLTFGFLSAQHNSSKEIAEALPKNEVSLNIDKTEKTEKKSKKDKADKKVKKADNKKSATRTPKRYIIDSSGQKQYVE